VLIAIALFDGFTVLDAVGPYHTVAHTPGYEFAFVAERAGMVGNGGSFSMVAHRSIDEVDAVDVLIVPGGLAAITMAETGGPLVDWIRAVHPTTTWTTSVCTGSLLLGAAGVLEGKRATSHWYALDDLSRYGAIPTDERVVEDGKVITAAGVSAGIDMGLILSAHLAGADYAQAVQLDMEYDPAPVFSSGHPRTAPPEVTAFVRDMYDSMLGRS
jgi:transcriptional regulator GlxA family with amidase domain